MIDIDICAFVVCVIGLVGYLWGYSSGSRFTLEQVNKQLEKKIKGQTEPVWIEVTTKQGIKFIIDPTKEADRLQAAKEDGLCITPLYAAPLREKNNGNS